ncbi:MAG: hypothetical protein Q9225_005513 [Loekoesia sp. 1 TL-2023]
MAILLTGGTGKTSTRLAKLLQDAGIPFLLASRRGEAAAPPGMPAIRFDWLDESTYTGPFEYSFPKGEKITAIYLVAPDVADPVPSMNAFIDYALEKHGVKRFVLLTGAATEKGGHHTGKVWEHLVDKRVEFCVLRATWFMENFTERDHFTIKNEGKIYTACGDGKIPFISAGDIAAVAFYALTDEKSHDTVYTLLGPELLTFDEVAGKFSKGLDRPIKHIKLSEEDKANKYQELGVPEYLAKFLAMLEALTAKGIIEQTNDDVQKVVGKPPRNLDTWIQENKTAWD